MSSIQPLACVLGDMDLVRPLGLAGISCAVAAPAGASPCFSRFTRATLEWADPSERAEELIETLVRFAEAQPEPPVLFYEGDRELLLVSRHRERLGKVFRFVVPDAPLVEDLVDKARFQVLAESLSLPVPKARRLHPVEDISAADLDLRFPFIIKPLTRRAYLWRPVGGEGKAFQVNSQADLRHLSGRLVAANMEVLAQELIPGPETCIESYHVYVDREGEVVGEFTGKKIRTYPERFGHSTALLITDTADVAALGRKLVRLLKLRGVAKFDFKRAPDGRLYLLEVNPRFNLWHHPGAVAGVNLPALVYGDLVGLDRPSVQRARPGIRWCCMWKDVLAAKADGVSFKQWLPWAMGCEAKRLLAWDDPLPFMRAALWRCLPWHRSVSTKRSSVFSERQMPKAADLGHRPTSSL